VGLVYLSATTVWTGCAVDLLQFNSKVAGRVHAGGHGNRSLLARVSRGKLCLQLELDRVPGQSSLGLAQITTVTRYPGSGVDLVQRVRKSVDGGDRGSCDLPAGGSGGRLRLQLELDGLSGQSVVGMVGITAATGGIGGCEARTQ